MNKEFKKMYPTGAAAADPTNPDGDSAVPRVITHAGATGTTNGALYDNTNVAILLTSTAATAHTLSNPKPGTTYIIEAAGTGVNDRVVTFSGCTVDAIGNNTATLDAQGESLAVMCLTTTRFMVVSNVGSVALSTV